MSVDARLAALEARAALADRRAAGFMLLASSTVRLTMADDRDALEAEVRRYEILWQEAERSGLDSTVFTLGLSVLKDALGGMK